MNDKTMTLYNQNNSLLVKESSKEIKEAARKLMRLTPGGNRLEIEDATDLAVYSFLTGLNPFNSECYFMTKVGPVPGIAGYRVKAIDYIRATTPASNMAPRVWEEYRPAEINEADYNPDAGDVAWVCTLFDSSSKENWEKRLTSQMLAYHQAGASFQEARGAALEDVGTCPSWTSVGVVHASERFSGNVWVNNIKKEDEFKPEMWDRNERAKKRAAKGCYRKGFPKMNVPDAEYGEIIDGEAIEIKAQIVDELSDEQAKIKSETVPALMSDLGFVDAVEVKPADTPTGAGTEQPEQTAKLPPTGTGDDPLIGPEDEYKYSHDGEPYADMATPDLAVRLTSMIKAKNPDNDKNIIYIKEILGSRQPVK